MANHLRPGWTWDITSMRVPMTGTAFKLDEPSALPTVTAEGRSIEELRQNLLAASQEWDAKQPQDA